MIVIIVVVVVVTSFIYSHIAISTKSSLTTSHKQLVYNNRGLALNVSLLLYRRQVSLVYHKTVV